MATLDELQQQLNALQQRVDAITAPPTDYYTQRYSGEETDRGVEIALGLDPEGTGIVTPEHGGTGADTTQAALANLGAGVRLNELDNPGLDINQQGQSSYNTSAAASYTVDRWWSFFANYDVATKTLTSTSQQYGSAFRQPLGNPSRFAGKTVTLTAWVLSGSGTIGLVKATGVNSGLSSLGNVAINGAGVYSLTVYVPADVGGDAYPYFIVTASAPVGGSIQFASPIPFKLEFGDGQTLAYQDSAGDWKLLPQPDSKYSAQLLECQRYQLMLKTGNSGPYSNILAYGYFLSATEARMMVPTPVSMRGAGTTAVPTMKQSGLFLRTANQSYPVTGVTALWGTQSNGISVAVTASGASEAIGTPTFLCLGGSDSYMLIDHNL